MKKILFLLLGLVLFVGCSKDLPSYSEVATETFTNGFIKEYGTPDKEHTWGFETTTTTRSADVNSNMWTWRPQDITQAESLKVVNHFKSIQNPTSINVNWINFFVQHVHSGHGNMDWLYCGAEDHINNFNATWGSIMKMINTSTSDFGYHNSLDSKLHNKYVIQYIDGGYYVGFDFEATGQNPNQKETADGYYTDWIVKISPAYDKMIIAEDLGASESDFDYNDVVFGVDGNVVTLLAAGGTLPLTVDGTEVHNAFGVATGTMVNTYNYYEYPPVQFKIGNYNNIKDIPLIVNKNGNVYNIPYFSGAPSAKICVNHNFVWCKERVPIDATYPLFKEYVKNQSIVWY